MGSQFLNHVRRNTRQNGPMQLTGKSVLLLLALIGMIASAIYWWGVQSQLTESRPIAIAFTAILVLAPPTLISFLIPWSPAGMLLQRVNAQDVGAYGGDDQLDLPALLLVSIAVCPGGRRSKRPPSSGLIYQQVLIGIIGFILIPALLWAPVSSEELVAQIEQDHIVKRYELQTQADIAILRATLLRAQEKALIGFANLTVDGREELAGVMRSLVTGIDRTLQEVGQSVKMVSGASLPFKGMLDDNDDIGDILDFIGESLSGSTLHVNAERADTASIVRVRDLPPRESTQIIDRAFDAATSAHVDSRLGSSKSRATPDATRRHTTPHDAAYLRAARDAFGRRPWTLKQLAAELQIGDTSAGALRDSWVGDGSARQTNLGRWAFDINEVR